MKKFITYCQNSVHQKHIRFLLGTETSRRKYLLVLLYLFTLTSLLLTFRQMLDDSKKNASASVYPLSSPSQASAIAAKVLRLHVIANSDSKEDQAIKRKVRDDVLSYLQNDLKNVDSRQKAEEIVQAKLPELEKIANATLFRLGSINTAKVTLAYRKFPTKTYGEFTFPAGTYRALCVEIGKAQGHNWWCVLFPSLCFVDETTATVPEDSQRKLKDSLTEEQYAELQSSEGSDSPSPSPEEEKKGQETKIEIRSGFLDWFHSLK